MHCILCLIYLFLGLTQSLTRLLNKKCVSHCVLTINKPTSLALFCSYFPDFDTTWTALIQSLRSSAVAACR